MPSSLRRTQRSLAALLFAALSSLVAPRAEAGEPIVLDMFTTSDSSTGDLVEGWSDWIPGFKGTGLEAGDAICQAISQVAGPTRGDAPTYRAWLSTDTTDAYCHVQGLTGKKATNCGGASAPAGPWFRRDGVPFSGTLDELVTNGPLSAASIDEAGNYAGGAPGLTWTGTRSDGTVENDQCSHWESTLGGSQAIGLATSGVSWTDSDFTILCGQSARLICFQQGAGAQLDLPVAPGALVFVTTESGTADLETWGTTDLDGLAGADEVCQAEAAGAFLPNPDSFLAWLSTSGMSAKDRFPTDVPWNRVDGVRVANDTADLTDGHIRAPIRVTATGVVETTPLEVWTGTFSGGTASASTCTDWSTTEVAETPPYGVTDEVGFSWTVKGTEACEKTFRLYCFSDVVILFWDNFESGGVDRWTLDTGFVP